MCRQASWDRLLINNTIFSNSAMQAIGSAIYGTGYDGPALLLNNLLIAPGTQNVVFCDDTFQPFAPAFENNDAFGSGSIFYGCDVSPGQYGNFSADPLLVDSANGDFHLTRRSPRRSTPA